MLECEFVPLLNYEDPRGERFFMSRAIFGDVT